jgi:cellulose synthase (UDP-forming)/cellulose synthase operon protein B
MTEVASDFKYSRGKSLVWGVLAFIGTCALGVLLVLPLPWNEQAIFGGALIAGGLLLNWFSRARLVTMALMAISVFSTFRYGYFRVIQTWYGVTSAGHVHQWDTVFVLLLLFAEFYAFATLVLGYFQTLRPLRRPPVPLTGNPNSWPTVDVFIPTYNESLSVVRATVLGALALDYPSSKFRVFVLDDGRRREFADFCSQVGAGYISRNNNVHAKAGNINHALGSTGGELVAIFDSDHIPTRSFLQTTLGWFQRDRRLGMVQTPHHFYSPDPFERNLGQFRKIPNEGELFHRLVQDGNDLWNASFFCGSCAVLRRKSLTHIGGIAVETVTEDAHTALRMQRRGWHTAYINIPQAAGLATESLAAHIGQRVRWARGMVQILRTENPLFTTGLSFSQRLCYFNATTHFLFALPRLIFLIVPLVYLLFGMVNIYGYSLAVFAYALPHIVLSNMTNSRVQGRCRFSFWNEIYEAVLAPYILFPTLLALINPRLGKFNVTSKGGIIRRSYFDRRIAWPFLLLLALNAAGLVMAERRFVSDPYHHDTVLMNTVWTVYNIVILSVAASVAWEKKQRRSLVRVNVRVPLELATSDAQRIAGVTAQLSGRGAMVRLARSVRFSRGTPVMLKFEANPSRCEIPARVVRASKRHLHLFFPQLSIDQEKFLVHQTYSRPEAWLSWHRSRPVDHPFRSLTHIFWLALRGIVVVLTGLFSPRPRNEPEAEGVEQKQKKGSAPAIAACVALAGFTGLICTPLHAADVGESATDRPDAQLPMSKVVPAPAFHDHYELGAMARRGLITLSGPGSAQNFFLDMPLTKIISVASLDLRYKAPLLRPGESWLEVWLNGTQVGSLPLAQGPQEASISLPADLLTSNNTLTFQLQGNCAACGNIHSPWVVVSPMSQLDLSGTRLPLPNDLALLPVPFFDSASQHSWNLPVVFSDRPGLDALKAASIVTSWFGIFSDFRGVRFPVTVGDLPDGNAVVFALRDSELASKLTLPSRPGAVLAIRDNPRDPYGKLLVIAGDSPGDLVNAARSLVTRNNAQVHADAVHVSAVNIPLRREYDAPRWLDASKPASIGTYTTAERLTLKGSGSVNVYFRIPPDLFLQARESVPLLLKYSYAGVAEGSRAALHVRLNDRDIDSIQLKPASSNVDEQEIVRLPTGRFQPYTNTLTIDVDFGHAGAPTGVWQYAAIHRESSIDLSGVPHSVVLPRLELFADSGYPFTVMPDLGRAAVVLSNAPTAAEYESLFDTMGFFGAQTGAPATNVTVTDPAHVEEARDKDLVLLGPPASQPLYSEWAPSMPLGLTEELRVNSTPELSRLQHPAWPFRNRDREKLAALLATGSPMDVVVEDFVSPFRPDRSVVAIAPRGEGGPAAIASLFTPALDKGPIYGGVAVAQNGRFRSFLVGTFAYHSGHVDAFQQTRIFLFEHYFVIPALVVLLAFFIAAWLYMSTERVAARRLALGRN